jgi:hypothetical protein
MEPEIVKTHSNYVPESEDLRMEEPTREPYVKEVKDGNSTPKTEFSTEQWLLFGYRMSEFIDDIPSYISYFFTAYKRPLVSIGLILVAFIAVRLALALLDALNDIPLLAQTLKLIGLTYTTWFVYRYLISSASRQELFETINSLKEYVLGRED